MQTIKHFDCRCILGPTLTSSGTQPQTAEELLAAMDHFGIHEALVLDSLSVANDPRSGNQRILERTREHPRLHPAWAGLMTHSRETPPPAEMVQLMRLHGVGALYLLYRQFQMPLEEWAIGDLLGELERAGAPVFLCADGALGATTDATDWPAVVRICRAFPNLPVIVTEERIYGSQRPMYEALAACSNLRVDMASIWLHKRVEFICEQFGADRLLWSSRMPGRTPAASLVQLDYSDISQEDLAAIAGDNLRELLSWNDNVRLAGDVSFPEPLDELHDKARRRASLRDEEFYDCHGHIGWGSNRHVVQDTPESIAAEMDKFGIRSCCVFSFAGAQPDEVYGNDQTAALLKAYPERFVGFTLVNPQRGEEGMLRELERGLAMRMQGVKLATGFQGYPDAGPLVDVACRFANDYGQLMLHHHWGPAEQMRRLCETYPDAMFITGHASPQYTEVAAGCDNLYICTCPFLTWGSTERFVELYGADRLLFGSDLMDLPIGWGLGPILYANIPLADKRKILGENLRRVMDRC